MMSNDRQPAERLLAHDRHGDGGLPTCLLLHGVGTTSWMWRRLVQELVDHLHVVTVDLPGHGASAWMPWRSQADTVARVAAVARHVAPDGPVHVVGLSLGGYIALDLAAQAHERVASVTASGVNVLPFPRPRLMAAAGRVMAPFMTTSVMLRANARSLSVPPEDVEGYIEEARSMADGTFLAIGRDLMGYAVPAGAGDSTSRVLALAGGDEQSLILRSLPKIAASFAQGEARVAPGVGHAWAGQAPELFAETVHAHVTDQPLPAQLLAPRG